MIHIVEDLMKCLRGGRVFKLQLEEFTYEQLQYIEDKALNILINGKNENNAERNWKLINEVLVNRKG